MEGEGGTNDFCRTSVPDSDAAGQHALNGTPVEGGEDGWREGGWSLRLVGGGRMIVNIMEGRPLVAIGRKATDQIRDRYNTAL